MSDLPRHSFQKSSFRIMGSQATDVPYKGTANVHKAQAAEPFALDITKEVLPSWERMGKHVNRSATEVKSINRTLHEMALIVKTLSNSDQKENLKQKLREVQAPLVNQYNDKLAEFDMYQRCLRAFNKTGEVSLGEAGEIYLVLFAEMLNEIENKEDVSVKAVLDTVNAVAVKSEILSKHRAKKAEDTAQDAGLSSKKTKVIRVHQDSDKDETTPVHPAPRKKVRFLPDVIFDQ
jgi:hypothetical protein